MKSSKMQYPEFAGKAELFKAFLIVLIMFVGMLTINEFKKSKYIGVGEQNTINVSGKGEVYAKPDLALVSFSVVSEAKTASRALADNSELMNEVIGFLKGSGIKENDLKTTIFSISPRYEWRDLEKSYATGQRVLVGYEVSQTLQVKIRDMDEIGNLIEGATDAGANQVSSLQFTFDDEDALKKQAREAAIREAKAKAKELARQLGVSLGKITSFYESSISPFYDAREAMYGMGGGGIAPEIETGENLVQSNVSVTYEIY